MEQENALFTSKRKFVCRLKFSYHPRSPIWKTPFSFLFIVSQYLTLLQNLIVQHIWQLNWYLYNWMRSYFQKTKFIGLRASRFITILGAQQLLSSIRDTKPWIQGLVTSKYGTEKPLKASINIKKLLKKSCSIFLSTIA